MRILGTPKRQFSAFMVCDRLDSTSFTVVAAATTDPGAEKRNLATRQDHSGGLILPARSMRPHGRVPNPGHIRELDIEAVAVKYQDAFDLGILASSSESEP